jgi:hypothetical protein
MVESMTQEKITDDAARYINENCQESTITQRGDYLMIEISSFETNVSNKLQKMKNDIVVEFDEKFEEGVERFVSIYRQSEKEFNNSKQKIEPEKKAEPFG